MQSLNVHMHIHTSIHYHMQTAATQIIVASQFRRGEPFSGQPNPIAMIGSNSKPRGGPKMDTIQSVKTFNIPITTKNAAASDAEVQHQEEAESAAPPSAPWLPPQCPAHLKEESEVLRNARQQCEKIMRTRKKWDENKYRESNTKPYMLPWETDIEDLK